MPLELLERHARGTSPIHRLDARLKVALAGSFVIAAVATPVWLWPVYVVQAVALTLVYAMSGLPWSYFARRLLLFLPFVILLSLGAPLSRGLTSGWEVMAGSVIKSLLSFSAVLVLMNTTPLPLMLGAMTRLKAPRLLVVIVALMLRYLVVLLDETERMRRAKLSRTFRERRLTDWLVLPNFVGILFLRSLKRAENVHQAMLARGWTGDFRTLDEP